VADWLTWGAGIAASLALVGLIVVVILLRRQEKPVELEVLGEEEPAPAAPAPVRLPAPEDDLFSVAKDELHPRSLAARPLPASKGGVPTEWARRQVGPLEPGRVRGMCSGCGTAISVSRNRPIRVACPVCGRTRLLS
jgi:hypothetical protein